MVTKGAVLAALLLTGAMFSPAPSVAVLTDVTAGSVVLCRPLADGERLALVFSHSMYGGDVVEEYLAADGGLRRIGMTTANAAAAEYYAYTSDVYREHGRFRVDVPDEEFEELTVRVDRVGDHRLIVDDDVIDLVELTGDRHEVRLRVRSISLLDRLPGRAC